MSKKCLWVVVLTSHHSLVERHFGTSYFPRKFWYKSDAEALAQKVRERFGATVVVEKDVPKKESE